MRIVREQVTESLIIEAMSLLEANYAETGAVPELPAAFESAAYVTLENAGMLRTFLARDDEGKIAGYTQMIVRFHPHQANQIYAMQDLLYLAPQHRKGSLGMRLIQHADDALREEGVLAVIRQSSERRNIAPLLQRMNYAPLENAFIKRLNHGH